MTASVVVGWWTRADGGDVARAVVWRGRATEEPDGLSTAASDGGKTAAGPVSDEIVASGRSSIVDQGAREGLMERGGRYGSYGLRRGRSTGPEISNSDRDGRTLVAAGTLRPHPLLLSSSSFSLSSNSPWPSNSRQSVLYPSHQFLQAKALTSVLLLAPLGPISQRLPCSSLRTDPQIVKCASTYPVALFGIDSADWPHAVV